MPTNIEWTEETWNPVRGCSRVSEGCQNCYAERQAARFCNGARLKNGPNGETAKPVEPYHGFVEMRALTVASRPTPHWTGKVELIDHKLEEPLHWRKPRMVFVNSMSDLFHESLSNEEIDRVFAVMALCPQHSFEVLTKRSERMHKYFSDIWVHDRITKQVIELDRESPELLTGLYPHGTIEIELPNRLKHWPLPNVWLGVSVENRDTLSRVDWLRKTPAALRFLSLEPLLEDLGELNLEGIGWVIVGGESGPKARPCDLEWIRDIVHQCKETSTPVFVKQLGAKPYRSVPLDEMGRVCEDERLALAWGREWLPVSGKGGQPAEWPADLRGVRQMPEMRR